MAMLVITRWYIQQTSAGLLLPPLRKLQASGVIRKVAGSGGLMTWHKNPLSAPGATHCVMFLREIQRKYVYIYIYIWLLLLLFYMIWYDMI